LSASPNSFVITTLGWHIAGKDQHELIENINSIDVKPNAFGGNIGDEAAARRKTNPELDSS